MPKLYVNQGRNNEMNKTSVAIAVVRSAGDQRFISKENDGLFETSPTIAPYDLFRPEILEPDHCEHIEIVTISLGRPAQSATGGVWVRVGA